MSKIKQLNQLPAKNALLKGRKQCECQAQLHKLVNNCTTCGRVICEQEGPGACFFCGNKITNKNEIVDFQTDSELMFPDLAQSEQFALEKAVKHKNTLLDYHKRDIHQSQVYDDQTDYYQIADNVWESEQTRTKAIQSIIQKHEKIDEDAQGINIQFDASTGQLGVREPLKFDEDQFRDEAKNFQQDQQMEEYKQKQQEIKKQNQTQNQGMVVDDRLYNNEQSGKLYQEIRDSLKTDKVYKAPPKPVLCSTVQNDDQYASFQQEVMQSFQNENNLNEDNFDTEFFNLETQDNQACLSMLQPWASLLVEGFKRVEGRHWNTTYRGPLWIHAGAQPPLPEDISRVEHDYEQLYKNVKNRPLLPSRYPTGALIGVVDLVGVMTYEQYENNVPEDKREEGHTDYKFIVRNPRKLFYPMSMRGAQNIFKIDRELRNTAFKLLQRVPTKWVEYVLNNHKFEEIQPESQSEILPNEDDSVETQEVGMEIEKQSQEQNYFNTSKVDQNQVRSLERDDGPTNSPFIESSHDWGMLIANILTNTQSNQIASYLESKIPKSKSQKVDQTQIKVSDQFPHTGVLIQSINFLSKEISLLNDKSLIQRSFGLCTIYYLKATDKNVSIDMDAFCLVCLGAALQITVVNDRKKQQIVLQEGMALVITKMDEVTKVNFSKTSAAETNSLSYIGQDYSYKSWLLIYSKV